MNLHQLKLAQFMPRRTSTPPGGRVHRSKSHPPLRSGFRKKGRVWLGASLSLVAAIGFSFLHGCSKPATNQGTVTPQGTERQVRSSADVVSLGGTGTVTSGDNEGEALVMLNIEPGYHVNANPATYPYLIATEVTADKVEGLDVGRVIYPPSKKQKFQFADEALAVYEGQVEVKLPFKVAGKGSRSLPLNVRVQACDDEKCFPPATLKTSVSVEVK